jgi:hypothetical protein
MNLARRLALGSLAPLAPGVEEAALHGQNAVKSGQKQRRTLRRLREQRNQLVRQAAGADQTPRPAGFVEGPKPAAEGRRILLPTGACRTAAGTAAHKRKAVRAPPSPTPPAGGAGLRAAWPASGPPRRSPPTAPAPARDSAASERRRSVAPRFFADKALPIENVGRGPGGQPLGWRARWKPAARARAARSLAVTTTPPSRSHALISSAAKTPILSLYSVGPRACHALLPKLSP